MADTFTAFREARSRLESGQAVEKPVYVALSATGLECQSRVAADLFE